MTNNHEARITALEIQVNALVAANTLLQGILDQAQAYLGKPASEPQLQHLPPPPSPFLPAVPLPSRFAPGTATRLEPDPSWFPVIHNQNPSNPDNSPGPPPCYAPAFYLIRKVTSQEKADRELMRVCHPGETIWRIPRGDENSVCSTCGQPINPVFAAQLDFSQAKEPEPTQLPKATHLRTERAKRRSRSASEVPAVRVVSGPHATRELSGISSPGPDGSPAEAREPTPPALIGPMTPEANAEAIGYITDLAQRLGLEAPGDGS